MSERDFRVTYIPYREWKLRHRIIERLYRWTHRGQVRTLVVRRHGSLREFIEEE